MGEIILKMQGIQKYFPGVHALDDAQLEIRSGEVMGLIGENGAGKSTLMKILTGIYPKDGGTIEYFGEQIEIHGPKDAQNRGICIVHQELNLMQHLTVADNIFIGRESTKGIFLDPCTPDYTFARASAANALWQKCRSIHRSELFSVGAPVTDDNTPVMRVFMNGNYAGLYRLLSLGEPLPKNAAVLYAASQSDACLFAEPPIFDEDNFLLKDFGGETPDDALRSFGEFSEFVRESSPQQFREELENYADLTALMDYFILCNFFGLPTGDTAGTVWSTTDGIHWTPSFDSLNNAFGLSAKGYQNAASDGIPPTTSDPNGVIVPYTGKNLLWKKLCAKFPLELRNRYQVLRDTFLTKQNVCDLFLTKFQGINDPLRKLERDLYPALPGTAWASRHVEEYVQTRLLKMDQWLYPIIFSQPS